MQLLFRITELLQTVSDLLGWVPRSGEILIQPCGTTLSKKMTLRSKSSESQK